MGEGKENLVTDDRCLFEQALVHQVPPGRFLWPSRAPGTEQCGTGMKTFGFKKKIQFIRVALGDKII